MRTRRRRAADVAGGGVVPDRVVDQVRDEAFGQHRVARYDGGPDGSRWLAGDRPGHPRPYRPSASTGDSPELSSSSLPRTDDVAHARGLRHSRSAHRALSASLTVDGAISSRRQHALCRAFGLLQCVSHVSEEGLGDVRVELCSGVSLDFGDGVFDGLRCAVGAIVGDRVERVDDREDPRCEGDLDVVRITTGIERSFGSVFISASASRPSFLGMFRSSRIRPGRGDEAGAAYRPSRRR
jgi:hypothetical protein